MDVEKPAGSIDLNLRMPRSPSGSIRQSSAVIGASVTTCEYSRVISIDLHHKEPPASTTPGIQARLRALENYAPLRDEIGSFWLDPEHRRASSWSDHRDINEVMLATSLAPDGFLSKRALSTAQR